MQVSRSKRLVRKAKAAMIAAIDVCNKPSFAFREETFAVLALTAWELLLKAKIVRDSGESLNSIYAWETVKRRDGKPSKKKRLARSRSGKPRTIELTRAIGLLDADQSTRLADVVRNNIYGLMEIRDTAVHFMNADQELAAVAAQYGLACVKNFVVLANKWFDEDFSEELTLTMAVGFIGGRAAGAVIPINKNAAAIVRSLKALATSVQGRNPDGCDVVLEVEVHTKRGVQGEAQTIRLTSDPAAPAMQLTQQQIRTEWPYTSERLADICRTRYSDFKQNKKYYDIVKSLRGDTKYHFVMKLDPDNPKTARQDRYKDTVLQVLDNHYTRSRT